MMPTAKRARMMVIGETFFLSSLQHSSVRHTAARPGMSWSRLPCSVVTFSTLRPVGPRAEDCSRALLMPSAPPGRELQSM